MLERDGKAYTFTGQGSQRVGMWADLSQSVKAKEIFQITDEIVGFPLSRLCLEGPLDQLTRTSNAQPAIVAHSLAVLAAAAEIHPDFFEMSPQYCLGHSVGELSAIAIAGAISNEQAIFLARQRGLLMEQLGSPGKMAALMGFESEEQIVEICQQSGAEVANLNGPAQIVISGKDQQITDAIRVASESKIKAICLAVALPFHSSLMEPVKAEYRKIIETVEFRDPAVPVVLNTTGRPANLAEEIKQAQVNQVSAAVLWDKSISWLWKQGVTSFWEFGPQPTLSGLLKRFNPAATRFAVIDYQSAQKLTLPNSC